MTGHDLRTALRAGKLLYGTATMSDSPLWPNAVGAAGLDFVFLDTEHTPRDRHALSWQCRAYQAMGIAPVVRIPSPDPYVACQALDGGAAGIVCPYVEAFDQIQDMVGAVRYRPLKGRRLAEALANPRTIDENLAKYLEDRNARSLLILNIESVPALEKLDTLLKQSPEVDAILIGPHDLSCSLGIPEQYDHPRFDEAVRRIIQTSRANKVGVGIHFFGSIELEVGWCKAGANVVLHSSDVHIVRHHLKRELDHIRRALGDSSEARETAEDII